ncbi:hypothetical protein LPJ73_007928 [Coemansia sp. RSA 2703]|nr:hypothetical protein LPJ73_007928 [Coemansia sp. RSA 2703]
MSAPSKAIRMLSVPKHAHGQRVDRYVLSQTHMPSSLLFRYLRKKTIAEHTPSGQRRKLQGSDRVHAGMQIQLPSTLVTSQTPPAAAVNNEHVQRFVQQTMPLLCETSGVAVFLKPGGLACQGGTHVGVSAAGLLAQMSAEYRLVHRLDRGTTGALVVARSRAAASVLAAAFARQPSAGHLTVEKTYYAVLSGHPQQPQGTITAALHNCGTHVRTAPEGTPAAKHAHTAYRVLRQGTWNGGPVSLVALRIATGRKHQIRVHCASVLRCPVLGDQRYGASKGELFLHLHRIGVPDVDAEGGCGERPLSVVAPFPEFWKPVFCALGVPLDK